MLPQSLLELQIRADAVALNCSLEELALRGSQFEAALISTQNTAALITGRGLRSIYEPSRAMAAIDAPREFACG